MFRRLWILTLLQLSDRLNLKKYKNSTKLATSITISIVGLILFTLLYCGILYVLCDLIMIPKNQTILTFIIFATHVLSSIACTHGLNNTLYYVLISTEYTGRWKYEYICEDWIWWKYKRITLLSEEEFNKLHNLSNKPITIQGRYTKINQYGLCLICLKK